MIKNSQSSFDIRAYAMPDASNTAARNFEKLNRAVVRIATGSGWPSRVTATQPGRSAHRSTLVICGSSHAPLKAPFGLQGNHDIHLGNSVLKAGLARGRSFAYKGGPLLVHSVSACFLGPLQR